MNQTIQAVLFDLGETLMYSLNPWPPVFDRAGRELSVALCENNVNVDCDTFHIDFRQRLDEYYADRERNLFETSTTIVLRELLAEKGQHNISEKIIRDALDQFYAVTQQNWVLEEDATPTLEILQESGFHLGLVSNAGDTRDVFQLTEKFGIEKYFDFIITSAECGYRKPHPRIFELALTNWGYLPDEIAMVGDRLDADVRGAQPLGIYAIWINRRSKTLDPSPFSPDYSVKTLGEIPPLLFSLTKSS
jgi:HAD superfamily hydrolase (TIGR01549 family)